MANFLIGMGILFSLPQCSIAQWKRAWEYNVTALTASGTKLFAGTREGVFLSTNNGESWAAVDSSGFPSVGDLGIDITCLAIIGENVFAVTYEGNVFMSKNNGASWMEVQSGLPKPIFRLQMSVSMFRAIAASGRNLFIAGSPGIYLSTNNGTTWKEVNSGLPECCVDCVAVKGTSIFAGTWYDGIFLSTNNGSSWEAVNSGLPPEVHVKCLAVSGKNLFAGTSENGVFLSADNGESWAAVNSGLPVEVDIYCLAASRTKIFVGTDRGVFLFRNEDKKWTEINFGLPAEVEVQYLAVGETNLFANIGGGYGVGYGVWRLPLSVISFKEREAGFIRNSGVLIHSLASISHYPTGS